MRILIVRTRRASARSSPVRSRPRVSWSTSPPDGEQGLERALAGDYDGVILDLLLPGQGGLEVLRQLQLRHQDLPVLVLSARSDIPTRLRGFEFGAVDYIVKPFSLDELLARVRLHMRRAAGAPSGGGSVLRVGILALDLARRQARMGDTVADLADREFRLLHFLMLHPGEVISRQRLLSEVWGFDFDPRSSTSWTSA